MFFQGLYQTLFTFNKYLSRSIKEAYSQGVQSLGHLHHPAPVLLICHIFSSPSEKSRSYEVIVEVERPYWYRGTFEYHFGLYP